MKKLNVLLVVPRYFSTLYWGYIMPLGIMYVSSALKQSNVANVFTLNLNHEEGECYDILKSKIKGWDIQVIGTGGISGQFREILPVFEWAKQIKPDIITIVGGGMITSDAETAMQALKIADYGIIGEGEHTLPELIDALTRNNPVEEIPGIIYLKESAWFRTEPRKEISDLDTVPLPDYLSFNYDKYLETNGETEEGVKYSPVAIIGGRSCKYNCTFCFHPTGSRYRQRSLDSIFHEIDFLIKHFNINYIALREELFASDNRRVLEFCDRARTYGLTWSIQLRVDSVNQQIVDALKASNCRYIFLGIESADNHILKSMRKHITVEQVESALDMTIKAGLKTRSTLIIGDERETLQSAYRTLKWWNEHKRASSMSLDMIIAFPGSTLYKHACKNGKIPDPVQFLQDGCPIINLSQEIDDKEFRQLVEDISNANGISYEIRNYT
ncbi:MAG: B12-binding domain-containing radical SAM protein [Tannerellaceae bacterium]|nr:B12-binding domain-containing radical SAM protein [Tannerellaceae bacterium]